MKSHFLTLAPFLALATFAVAAELPRAAPETLGLSLSKLAETAAALDRLAVDEKGGPRKVAGGVALVARHGQIAWVKTFGFRDLATQTAMSEDTIFAMASMTKPLTCTAALTLIEEGRFNLDDPVTRFLPELTNLRVLDDAARDTETTVATIPVTRPITIRHLLTHTSGFAYGALVAKNDRMDRCYARAGVYDDNVLTLKDRVDRLARVPLAHQPGEGFTYGFSHDVLGRVLEVATGQSLSEILARRITGPLDMHDTTYFVPPAKQYRVATIYDADANGTLTPLPKSYGSETYFGGGSGLFSTARDYGRFLQMLMNNGTLGDVRILRRETVDEMTRNQIGDLEESPGRKYGYGLGLLLGSGAKGEPGRTVLQRYYWGGAYSTKFWVDPRNDLFGICLTQVQPTDHGGASSTFHLGVNAAIEEQNAR